MQQCHCYVVSSDFSQQLFQYLVSFGFMCSNMGAISVNKWVKESMQLCSIILLSLVSDINPFRGPKVNKCDRSCHVDHT